MSRFSAISSTVLLVFLLFLMALPSQSSVIYVKRTGSDTFDGTSWQFAKASVQGGINTALSGDEVWVASGTYYGSIVTLKSGVKVYGGFKGTETSFADRPSFPRSKTDPYASILDGNKAGSVVTMPTGTGTTGYIDGFTITNGAGTANGSLVGGAAVFSKSCPAATVSNCIITGNNVKDGGGIYAYSGNMTVSNCSFSENTAEVGGSVYSDNCRLTFSNNTITTSTASTGMGGAIYIYSGTCSITGNTISGNTSSTNPGSAIYCNAGYTTISNNTITENSGGIYCSGGTPTISDNVITKNSSKSGAGVYCLNATAKITGNTVNDNYATDGGGIETSGGTVKILSNTVMYNRADTGGGIYCKGGTVTIANNFLAGNSAGPLDLSSSTSAGYGGAINCDCSSTTAPKIVNNTIIGNGAIEGGAIYSKRTSSAPEIVNNIIAFNSSGLCSPGTISTIVVKNNCFYNPDTYNYSGVEDQTGKNGNICKDPGLIFADYGCPYLLADSPCVNSGDDSYIQSDWVDMDDQNRIYGDHVDIGSAELTAIVHDYTPAILHVSLTGDDSNDGKTWGSAKKTIKAAINAVSAVGGGEVWVKAGTYTGAVTFKAFTYLYGGFVGNESAKDGRDWTTNVTVIDGNKEGSSVTAFGGFRQTCIEGFTIKNGIGTVVGTQTPPRYVGGGIFCNGASTIVRNNIISDCTSGGGIYSTGYMPVITNNTISANTGNGIAASNAALISDNAVSDNSEVGIYACGATILANASANSVVVQNNTLTRNGGGISAYGQYLSAKVYDNYISGCHGGNGMATMSGIYCFTGNHTISGNVIVGHASTSGTGIYLQTCSGVISNNIVANGNTNGMYISTDDTCLVCNNTIVGNNGVNGGGVYFYWSSKTKFFNNIVAFNRNGLFKDANTSNNLNLRNNCVYNPSSYNYSGVIVGAGDISVDPLFADRANNDYHLTADSPCINAVVSDFVGVPAYDLDNQPRIGGSAIDIGADEYWATIKLMEDLKSNPDNVLVDIQDAIATAIFNGSFYVEADDRSSGIRVEKSGNVPTQWAKVNVTGKMATNLDGERYIAAVNFSSDGNVALKPLGLACKFIGGGGNGLQQGVFGWQMVLNPSNGNLERVWKEATGLNNIGLLVRTWGKISYEGSDCFIDDGSNAKVKVVLPSGVSIDPTWQYISVTGISSCEKTDSKLTRVLKVRNQDDIVHIN